MGETLYTKWESNMPRSYVVKNRCLYIQTFVQKGQVNPAFWPGQHAQNTEHEGR